MLTALRCPECTAPVRTLPRPGERGACAYCGAILAALATGAGRTEEHFYVVLRVGPSNLDRVARVLHERASLALEEARALALQPRFELAFGKDGGLAREVARAAAEAGAFAEIASREVAVPLFTVTLEDAGAEPLRVIVALRAQVELSVAEAKRIVAETPSVLATGVGEEEARALAGAIVAAGAKASLRVLSHIG